MKCHFLIVVFILFISACSKNDACFLPQVVQAQAGLYSYGSDTTRVDTSFEDATLCLSDYSLCYFQSAATSNKLVFLLNPNLTEQEFILIQETTGVEDTFTIFYTPKLDFISNNCGYQYFFDLDSTKHTSYTIDSININAVEVTDERNKEHINFIFK